MQARNLRPGAPPRAPTAHIPRSVSGGMPGASSSRTGRASPMALALALLAAMVLLVHVGPLVLGGGSPSQGSEPSAGASAADSAYAGAHALAESVLLRGGRADASSAGGAAPAAASSLTQIDIERAVSAALAAQESALLRKLQAAGAISAPAAGGGGGGGGAMSGACPDHSRAVRAKVGKGDVRLIVVVYGTRPEAIKLAPLVTALTASTAAGGGSGLRSAVVTVATGQHEDMLKSALASFGDPAVQPDVSLDLMSHGQTLGALGGRLLTALSCVLEGLSRAEGLSVGAVVVQGDTITAAQAATAGFLLGIPVAHVEAGLRTFVRDDPFPEEVARTGITSQASLHLAPTRHAASVLIASGVCAESVHVVGNTGIDALVGILRGGASSHAAGLLAELGLAPPDGRALAAAITGEGDAEAAELAGAPAAGGPITLVVTMHRRENIGARMEGMLEGVRAVAKAHAGGVRMVLPVHPNPAVKAAVEAALAGVAGVTLLPPVPYASFVWVLAAAHGVLTDSGGLQEEAVALGRYAFVMRQTSERPEALRSGLAQLVGTEPEAIAAALGEWIGVLRGAAPRAQWPVHLRPRGGARRTFGDGAAALRMAALIRGLASAPAPREAGGGGGGLGEAPCRRAAPEGGLDRIGTGAAGAGARARSDHSLHAFASHAGLGDTPRAHAGGLLTGHARFGQAVECAAPPAPHVRPPQRMYAEAMQLASYYLPARDAQDPAFGVTAIVSVWKRPQVLERMIEALLAQSHAVAEIWVTTFASAHEGAFRAIIEGYKARGEKRVKFVAGDPQFKYFGRFALAIMAKTPHVLLLDDDSIPGSLVLGNALHLMYTRNGDYYGVVGMKGHDAHVEAADNIMPDYFSAFVKGPDKVVQVDLCGGFWLSRTEWLRHMFSETPLTWESGEDFHLTAMLRKHANLPTFLLPSDPGDQRSWGYTPDFIEISAAGDSTSDFMHKYRSNIAYGLMASGYQPVHAADTWGERHGRANVLLLLRSDADAAAAAPLHAALSASALGASLRLHLVLAGDPRGGRGGALDAASAGAAPAGEEAAAGGGWDRELKARVLKERLGVEWELAARRVGVWDLNLGFVPALPDVPDLPPPRSLEGGRLSRAPVHIATRAATALAGVLSTLRPALIIAVHDEASPVTAGAALAAGLAAVPLLGLALPPTEGCGAPAGEPQHAHVNARLATLTLTAASGGSAPWRGTATPVCEPDHPWTIPRGGFNAVTNSPSAALEYVLATLCSCEATSSEGDTAFASCPSALDAGWEPVEK